MIHATIDLSRINANYSCLSEGKILYPVLKADAYGHGLSRVSESLYRIGARRFAVFSEKEALFLLSRYTDAEVLLLFPAQIAHAALFERGAVFPLTSPADAEQLSALAQGTRRRVRVHLALNSGMNRIGFSLCEEDFTLTLAFLEKLLRHPLFSVEGAFSHLGEPPDTPRGTRALCRFFSAASYLASRAPELLFHVAATPSLAFPVPPELASLRMASRAGLSLYGYGADGVLPAMTLEGRVAEKGLLRCGEVVGYGNAPAALSLTETAVIPVGYADGLPREAAGGFFLDKNGATLPILGRISMNQTVLAVKESHLSVGDPVTLIDRENRIMPALCRASGRIPYEILLAGSRAKRKYLT